MQRISPSFITFVSMKSDKRVLLGMSGGTDSSVAAMRLQEAGYEVFVVSNACSSRQAIQNVITFQRLLHHDIDAVSIEMVVFEWLEKSDAPQFKEIVRKYVI